MKKRRMKSRTKFLLWLGMIVAVTIVSVSGVSFSASGEEPVKRICNAPNAIWLEPETQYQWISYQILQEDGKYRIVIDLPEDTLLYLTYNEGLRSDVRESPRDEIWIRDVRHAPPNEYVYIDQWFSLAPIPITSLTLEEHAGLLIYVDMGGKKWLRFSLVGGRPILFKGGLLETEVRDRVVPKAGFIEAEIKQGTVESDINGCVPPEEES